MNCGVNLCQQKLPLRLRAPYSQKLSFLHVTFMWPQISHKAFLMYILKYVYAILGLCGELWCHRDMLGLSFQGKVIGAFEVSLEGPSPSLPNPRKSRRIKQPSWVGGWRINTLFCNPLTQCWTDTSTLCSCCAFKTCALLFSGTSLLLTRNVALHH